MCFSFNIADHIYLLAFTTLFPRYSFFLWPESGLLFFFSMPADNRKSRLVFDEVVGVVPLVIHAVITILASCCFVQHLTAFLCNIMLIITMFAFNFRCMRHL